MTYDIIIPHLHLQEVERFARQCFNSIRRFSSAYQLIVIDNGGLHTSGILMDELSQHDNLVIIQNQENVGFVQAVNQGLASSSAPYIVIMNNDTIATPRWLEVLRAELTGDIGIAGPRSKGRIFWQGRERPGPPVVLPSGAMLSFFCVMMRRDVFEKIGYLDEDFGLGFGDDDNYCARAEAAGFRLVFVPNVLIHHQHRATFRALYSHDEIHKMQLEALEKHRGKMQCG